MLPEEVSIITAEQRDWDDSYIIDSGRTYCFEFDLEDGQVMEFGMTHTRAESQDLTLRCWFSEKPFGKQEFTFIDSMDIFSLPRLQRTIAIGSPDTDNLYKMPAGKTLYVMIQNVQNSENFFKLTFNIKA